MRHLLATILVGSALSTAWSATASPASEWEAVLSERLADPDEAGLRRFDYGGFVSNAANRAALDAYIADLAASGEPKDDAEATAFWANLYNAVTIDVVADNYPVKSIREIRSGLFSAGPWKRKLVTVDGNELSLDDIEHDILRERYPSPLIHYMVNCASIGCPNLQPTLWNAATLDADRASAAREFINSPRGVRVEDGDLVVSSIYKWFDEDFGDSRETVIAHILDYADADTVAAIGGRNRYDGDAYDWSLNVQD